MFDPHLSDDDQPRDHSPVRLSFEQGTLTLCGVSNDLIKKVFEPAQWVFDVRSQSYRTDAYQYREVVDRMKNRIAGTFQDEVPDWKPISIRQPNLHHLRADQTEAVDAWMKTRRGVVVMPTGTGKTEVALQIICRLGCSVLVVAPVRDLMYQWHERIIKATGIDAGIIGDGVHRVSPISVTTYDSASIHMARIGNRFELIIFDECHHLPSPMRQDAALMCAAPYRLGLTATPQRGRGKVENNDAYDEFLGPRVYTQAIEAARGKTLAAYDVIRIAVHLSDEERSRYTRLGKIVAKYISDRRADTPDYDWKALCRDSGHSPEARRALVAFHAKRSIEDRAADKLRIIEDLFRLHAGEPVIVFCGSNAMARDVSLRFLIPCLLSHCRKRERQEILSGLREGRYPAIVANRVLDEGVDLPEVNVAIVVGGGAGTRQALQRLGRVLRKNQFGGAVFYEIVTAGTRDELRSRSRRSSDAFRVKSC
ncbi:excinuclease ABC subunit B [Novipirellula aureliae]|uniref:Excinuclease ABC subunit B n=1 Tax=Novipirellula aureliae TaxID=2527966 RepID=A0A5C6DV89_9BACT|nr:DEAD/DEAH box helicase family protein [Novipirellula aureliae]TWU40255.1 excinuclease ABC subunit B [Novipirellula aureliae]